MIRVSQESREHVQQPGPGGDGELQRRTHHRQRVVRRRVPGGCGGDRGGEGVGARYCCRAEVTGIGMRGGTSAPSGNGGGGQGYGAGFARDRKKKSRVGCPVNGIDVSDGHPFCHTRQGRQAKEELPLKPNQEDAFRRWSPTVPGKKRNRLWHNRGTAVSCHAVAY